MRSVCHADNSSDAPFCPNSSQQPVDLCRLQPHVHLDRRMARNRRRNPRPPQFLVLHLRRLLRHPKHLFQHPLQLLPLQPHRRRLHRQRPRPKRLRLKPVPLQLLRNRANVTICSGSSSTSTGINSRCRCTASTLRSRRIFSNSTRSCATCWSTIHNPSSFVAKINESRNCPSGFNEANSFSVRSGPPSWVPHVSLHGTWVHLRAAQRGRRCSSYPTAIPAPSNPSRPADGGTIRSRSSNAATSPAQSPLHSAPPSHSRAAHNTASSTPGSGLTSTINDSRSPVAKGPPCSA